MKILWFSNIKISNNISTTGTWIYTMANNLIDSKKVELINITEGDVSQIVFIESIRLKQWIIPKSNLRNGLPNQLIIDKIKCIVEEVNPDLVHIWGTENYWGLLFSRGFITGRVLLDIQGLKYIWYKYFFSGLSYYDILKCITWKDFLKPQYSIIGRAISFRNWGKYELEILKGISNIGVQSNWVRAQITYINPAAKLFSSNIQLRNSFISGNKWDKNKCRPLHIFTSTSAVLSYKGLHILIEAIYLLEKKYNGIKLTIAGYISPAGIRQNGYDKFLMSKITNYNLSKNIVWLGSLDADSLSVELLNSNVCVIPSFIESYCVALDEALALGIPSVVSFTGAMPELAKHELTALYYSSNDIVNCAYQIERLFDLNFAEIISENAYKCKQAYFKITDNTDQQIFNYNSILSDNYSGKVR